MTSIGVIGSVSVGKTSILRLFVRYLQDEKIQTLEGGKKCDLIKVDFSGESILDPESGVKETKTIHPNRVVFQESDTKANHTLFAPGGDQGRAVVKMGVITISRIAKEIIALFACNEDIEKQLKFFSDVRFYPRGIFVGLNKYDLITADDKEAFLEDIKSKIETAFAARKIKVAGYFITVGETLPGMNEYNDNAAKMILDICLGNVSSK